jgi:hypothetical protein
MAENGAKTVKNVKLGVRNMLKIDEIFRDWLKLTKFGLKLLRFGLSLMGHFDRDSVIAYVIWARHASPLRKSDFVGATNAYTSRPN